MAIRIVGKNGRIVDGIALFRAVEFDPGDSVLDGIGNGIGFGAVGLGDVGAGAVPGGDRRRRWRTQPVMQDPAGGGAREEQRRGAGEDDAVELEAVDTAVERDVGLVAGDHRREQA